MITQVFRLRSTSRSTKLFLTAFLLVLTFGYAFGLAFVRHTTEMSPQGILEQYRGSTANGYPQKELKYEKTLDEMLTFTHNHVLSTTLLFFIVGGILLFSSTLPGRWKTFLLVEPFAAILTTFGGLWLLRFASIWFVWLVILSGDSMAICYIISVTVILRELWVVES
ncbi:MAG: hypothetical protein AABZ61_13410 [Bacteroidota bacterium]